MIRNGRPILEHFKTADTSIPDQHTTQLTKKNQGDVINHIYDMVAKVRAAMPPYGFGEDSIYLRLDKLEYQEETGSSINSFEHVYNGEFTDQVQFVGKGVIPQRQNTLENQTLETLLDLIVSQVQATVS